MTSLPAQWESCAAPCNEAMMVKKKMLVWLDAMKKKTTTKHVLVWLDTTKQTLLWLDAMKKQTLVRLDAMKKYYNGTCEMTLAGTREPTWEEHAHISEKGKEARASSTTPLTPIMIKITVKFVVCYCPTLGCTANGTVINIDPSE